LLQSFSIVLKKTLKRIFNGFRLAFTHVSVNYNLRAGQMDFPVFTVVSKSYASSFLAIFLKLFSRRIIYPGNTPVYLGCFSVTLAQAWPCPAVILGEQSSSR
jgi:ABC-type anion transport system duplicated permease subunit